MLTTASQFTPRARSLPTHHVLAGRVLGASTAGIRHRQQTRGFRFGMWSSYIDPNFSREIRRRQRSLKHKYAEQINRRLSWDKQPFAEDARIALKRMMKSYWHSHDARAGRHINGFEANRQRTPENWDGARPGQNIEDVERGAMEHLMFGEDGEQDMSHRQPGRNRRTRKPKSVFVPHTSYGSLERDDFVIDPITNRKVAKHPAPNTPKDGVDIPVKTSKDYPSRNLFDEAPSPEELRKYRQVEIDANPEDTDAAVGAFGKPRPILQSDEYVQNHGPFKPDHGAGYAYNSTTEIWLGSPSTSSPKYNDLHKYKPVMHNEDAVQESSPKYDDLHLYKSDVKDWPVSPADSAPAYPDLDKYKPVVEKEPAQFEDLKPPYEDLDNYRSVVVDEIAARFSDEKAPCNDLDKYGTAELKKYTPVGYLEPDGKSDRAVEEPSKNYDPAEVAKYKAVRYLEPDGNPGPTAEELSKIYDPEELAKYKPVYWNEPHGQPPPSSEELSKNYDPVELAKYRGPVYWNEPDGKPPPSAEELSKNYKDLDKYDGPVTWNEPDGKPPPSEEELSKDYDLDELAEYRKPVRWNEPDGKPPPTEEESSKDYKDLDNYGRAVRWNEPDGKPAPTPEELSKYYNDLDKYGPVRHQEPDGKPATQRDPVQESLEEVDSQKDYESGERLAPGGLDGADETSAEVLRKLGQGQEAGEAEKSDYRKMLDSLMEQYQTASDAADKEASLAVKSAKAKAQQGDAGDMPGRTLTGNYVRDFPEEFEKSWSETLSSGETDAWGYDTKPQGLETSYENEVQAEAMNGGLEGAFGRPEPSKIQPALSRHSENRTPMSKKIGELAGADLYSKHPQGLETSYAEECGNPTMPVYVKSYGSLSPAKAASEAAPEAIASGEPSSDSKSEPTLYKILAYDPTMQKVNVAYTTSFVPDTASPLTPPDVLLRLSNPTKFFPHFAPLEAEGYEIVSGSGDVLVFRKARPATTLQGEEKAVETQGLSTAAEPEVSEARINPIDMTGRPRSMSPASANFASPTGYVNYDNLPGTEASNLPPPPPPRLKYNIDVRREEPVFSGPKTKKTEPDGRKKKSMSKRLVVGGVWVAGISYALGVVSEYFTTGGADGLGPKGL